MKTRPPLSEIDLELVDQLAAALAQPRVDQPAAILALDPGDEGAERQRPPVAHRIAGPVVIVAVAVIVIVIAAAAAGIVAVIPAARAANCRRRRRAGIVGTGPEPEL